jgi:putative hydrolase of the HAD superfamily
LSSRPTIRIKAARAGSARAAASFPRLPAFRQFSYFDPIIVSGDLGYRKPDRRLFQLALDGMKVAPQHAMYVGNDMHRDIFGGARSRPDDRDGRFRPDKKAYQDCVPDYTITDLRELLTILG